MLYSIVFNTALMCIALFYVCICKYTYWKLCTVTLTQLKSPTKPQHYHFMNRRQVQGPFQHLYCLRSAHIRACRYEYRALISWDIDNTLVHAHFWLRLDVFNKIVINLRKLALQPIIVDGSRAGMGAEQYTGDLAVI